MAQYDSDTCSDYKCVIDTPEGPFEWDEDGKWEKCTIPWPEMWGNDECFPIKGRGSIKMTWEGDPCPNPIAKLGWIVLFVIFGGMGTAVTLAVVCQAKSEEKWCWRRKFDRPVNDLSKFEQIDAIKADEEETKKKWEEHHEKQRQIDERFDRRAITVCSCRRFACPMHEPQSTDKTELVSPVCITRTRRHSAIRSVAEQATIPGSVLSGQARHCLFIRGWACGAHAHANAAAIANYHL